jgi:pectinesterase
VAGGLCLGNEKIENGKLRIEDCCRIVNRLLSIDHCARPLLPEEGIKGWWRNLSAPPTFRVILIVACIPIHLLLTNSTLAAQPDFIVDSRGRGDFRTIQEAVNACRDYAERRCTILVREGTYREKLVFPSWKTNISLMGEDADSTIITYDDYSGKSDSAGRKITTFTSYTCLVAGNNTSFENLTVCNTAGRVGQAVALHVEGDRCVFRNCRLIGNQDTHLAAGENSRQYYQHCFIEGTTDFIFGPATAVFESCTVVSKKNSYITAASTLPSRKFGFVFLDCTLLADSVAAEVYLGRPWRLNAYTAFIRCRMGGHILPAGWHNWSKPEAEKTARYFEYGSSGPGANPNARVPWSHQLTVDEARAITPESVLAGEDNWNPRSSIAPRQ